MFDDKTKFEYSDVTIMLKDKEGDAMIQRFKNRYQANKMARQFLYWNTKIIKRDNVFLIQCNGTLYYRTNGYVY